MMNTGAIPFFSAVVIFLVALTATAAHFYRRRPKAPYGDWESLLARFTSVDRESITLIALDLVDESGIPRQGEDDIILEPSCISPLIGGMDGLEVLKRNCAVLVDLAFYVQQWYPEALVVAEQLRQNAREIEWHIDRLRGAAKIGKLEAVFPEYGQRVVAIYYLMTRHVLALYEVGNFPGLVDLQRAL
jgi:hypothetical protein